MVEGLRFEERRVVQSAGLAIHRLGERGIVNLRIIPDAASRAAVTCALQMDLPLTANTYREGGGLQLGWFGPDEWALLGPPQCVKDAQVRLAEELGGIHHALVDVSGNRVCFSVRGPRAADLLSVGCSLDMQSWNAADRICVQTILGRAPVMIVWSGTERGYEVYPRRSFADYLVDWFRAAAREFAD